MRLLLLLLLLLAGCIQPDLPIKHSEASSWRPCNEPIGLDASLKVTSENGYEYKVTVRNNTKMDLIIGVLVTVTLGEERQQKEITVEVLSYKSKTFTGEALFSKPIWNKQAEILVKTTLVEGAK